jgi:hypothetical protein
MLLAVCVLFIICAMLAMQLPGLASGLAGGFSFHTGSLARLTFGKAMGAARSLPDARTRGAAAVQAGTWTAATARRALTRSGGSVSSRLPSSPSRLP